MSFALLRFVLFLILHFQENTVFNIGNEPSSFSQGTALAHSSSHQHPHTTSEEQMKKAQRMGFINHLPTGIYDGSKKNRE